MRRYALALLFLALVACSSGPGALPKVPDFTTAATTTTEVDYSQVGLRGVTGHGPTSTIVLGPGNATLSGTVIGDAGAIPGATVQIQRIAAGATASTTVQSAADGTWTLPQILGGRYRLRAWRAPDLAQTSWTAEFLGASDTQTVELRVKTVGGLNAEASMAPDPPTLGNDANLVVLVTVKQVDDTGVVRATPQPDVPVDLSGSSGWRIMTENPANTDSRGEAAWTLRCRAAGHQPLAVTIGDQTIPLDVSDCVEGAPATTTTTAEVSLVP